MGLRLHAGEFLVQYRGLPNTECVWEVHQARRLKPATVSVKAGYSWRLAYVRGMRRHQPLNGSLLHLSESRDHTRCSRDAETHIPSHWAGASFQTNDATVTSPCTRPFRASSRSG